MKETIQQAVQQFAKGKIAPNTLELFKTLGYDTAITIAQTENSYSSFKQNFVDLSVNKERFNENKALANDWVSIDFLFQLADNLTGIMGGKVNNQIVNSIVFASIELSGTTYSKSQLAEITRQVNLIFAMPVVLLFKYNNCITLSIIHRRINKQDEQKDVLEKVSLIKDISIHNPHRAQIEILHDFAFSNLSSKKNPTNFVELINAWETVFNTKTLNTKFYNDLFKWYLYAKDNVKFPNDLNENHDSYTSESLIRFISRMLFVWFMKEKKLIPEVLFDKTNLNKILANFDATNDKNTYYKAILQNLFFATLNVPTADRKWIDRDKKNKEQKDDPLIYRFASEFIDSVQFIETVFMKIPFLNGGLFDCLDIRDKDIFIEGFTKAKEKQTQFPNKLFFGKFDNINLNHHFEGDATEKKKWQNVAVFGIIDLLDNYKFTIEENTPLEIDVALDPELLGKVFENLLASFNPETKSTARKQTGSFYTPREIVNYMVDESLKQHLLTHLPAEKTNIDNLFKNETENLKETTKKDIVEKLFDCKILDPACGSGAYPMGILHKMVELLDVLDPKNNYLKELENKKLEALIKGANQLSNSQNRQQTIEVLEKQKAILQKTEYNYVRKLYIIENCIHGVDIQPIAIQISKLRFFISLLVEQVKNESLPNFGIEALPNMDFKLVAANTLIAPPAEEKGIGMFAGHNEFFEEFEQLAHDYFSLYTPASKKLKKDEIKTLINAKIEEKKRLINSVKNSKGLEASVVLWESYKNLFKEKAVLFFETPYFFPKVKDGFDVVIGNPPYVQCPKGIYSPKQFPYSEGNDKGKQNLYKVFVEGSYNLLRENGVATMIVQSSLMCDISSQFTRELLLKKTVINHILEFPKKSKTKEGQVFENVLQGTCVYNFVRKIPTETSTFNVSIDNDTSTINKLQLEQLNQFDLLAIYQKGFFIPLVSAGHFSLINKIFLNSTLLLELISDIRQGDLNLTSEKNYFSEKVTQVKLLRGKNTHKYEIDYSSDEYIQNQYKQNIVNSNYKNQYFVCQQITGTTDKFRIHLALTDKQNFLFGNSVNKFKLKESKNNKVVLSVINSSLID